MTTSTVLLDTAEEVARWLPGHGITAAKLKQWARREHITRYPGGLYEMKEVADYLDGRTTVNASRALKLAERNRRLIP